MTTLGDLFGKKADFLVRMSISVGDVHRLPLSEKEGITPKNSQDFRNKYFIVLGFDSSGNIIGGVVINSNVNNKLPSVITDYMLEVKVEQCQFLKHNSFVNCSHLIVVNKEKFSKNTFVGRIEEGGLMDLIIGAVTECPMVSRQLLREFGLIK